MHNRKILIIGEVYVDQHLDIIENGYSTSRLGGIFHAARSCDALNIEYALAYYAPDYLVKDVEKFGIDVLRASSIFRLGKVDKAPNVMLIGQSDESGNQLYENILGRQAEYVSMLPFIAFMSEMVGTNIAGNMAFAAWMSSLYAQTIQQEKFKENVELIVQNIEDFVEMEGIRVPWNERVNYPIYMAAPDFDYVDTEKLDILEDSLLYHNFKPRRPIQENGQVNKEMDMNEERAIFAKDMELLSECKIMIATLLYNDQGTLVEIGNYQANGKPIILYDPYLKLDNMFLKNSCTYYCKTKSQVIDAVFTVVSRMVKNGE